MCTIPDIFVIIGAIPHRFAAFGQGTGPIVLSSVYCQEDENLLVNCSFSYGSGDCFHNEDAGVQCLESPSK